MTTVTRIRINTHFIFYDFILISNRKYQTQPIQAQASPINTKNLNKIKIINIRQKSDILIKTVSVTVFLEYQIREVDLYRSDLYQLISTVKLVTNTNILPSIIHTTNPIQQRLGTYGS